MKNVPNILTIARIGAIAVFVLLASLADLSVLHDKDWVIGLRIGAFVLAFLAGLTDLFDGYLARKYKCVSDFGALMDPLADKIFVTATMLFAIEYKLMPAWIPVTVLGREFMVTGLRALAAKKQVIISADRWGKLKTALQMVMLAIAGVAWMKDGGTAYLHDAAPFGIRLWYVWICYLCGIVVVTLFSGFRYFYNYRHLFLPENDK